MHRRWTIEEDDFLRQYYVTMPRDEIEAHLHRSEYSIWKRAARLGLKKDTTCKAYRRWRGELISIGKKGKNQTSYYRKGHMPENPHPKGSKLPEETRLKIQKSRKRQIYNDLWRLSNGLPQLTRQKLKKRYYIDRKKYIDEDDEE